MTESAASVKHTVSIRDLTGEFAFKFNGSAIVLNVLWHVFGVGHFEIKPDGGIIGRHRSSISPVQGQAAQIINAAYSLDGNCYLDSGEISASINFTKTSGKGRNVKAKFYVQVAGTTDRLWFITSNATLLPDETTLVDEFVTLEAVRMKI
jgi:hypothetical protein